MHNFSSALSGFGPLFEVGFCLGEFAGDCGRQSATTVRKSRSPPDKLTEIAAAIPVDRVAAPDEGALALGFVGSAVAG